jgi:adenylate cyclase
MFTDMVGYTAIGQSDESLSLALIDEQRNLIRPVLGRHNGHEVKTIGDAFLVEFDSALEAVRCAMEIQSALKKLNGSRPPDRTINVRIGIHIGDVIHDDGDVWGDAVNVAARIEPLAPSGGICVSGQVHASVLNKVEQRFDSLGTPQLKNVSAPVEVYQIEGFGEKIVGSFGNRIAVLPFANLSPDAADEYFADGLTEELIDRLAQVKSLKVIARTSVMGYKKQDKRASEIAKELGVNTLVEGSVRKTGKRVRITVQLISARADEHLWSSRYDRDLDDIFAVQTEIAESVAGELRAQLLESEMKNLKKRSTENIEAYADFLRGRELLREASEPSLREALRLFGNAIALDPSFARAHVGLAECHQWLADGGYEPLDDSMAKMRAPLNTALELDSDLSEAHASRSVLLMYGDDDAGAEVEAKRALELNPSLPDPYNLLYEVAAIRGDTEEMVRLAEIGYALDPLRPLFALLLGQAYLWTGREEQALAHVRRVEHLVPSAAFLLLTEYYFSKADLKMVRKFHAKFAELRPTSPWVPCIGGMIDAMEGRREEALLAIKKIEEANIGPVGFNYVAYIYNALGDSDSYFQYLNRALESHAIMATPLMYSSLSVSERKDPRYDKLVDKLRRQTGLAK